MKLSVILAITTALCSVPCLLSKAAAAEPVRYNRDVRPILSDNCFACHGPDKANQKGGLRLDVRDAAVSPLSSGAKAIVPGKPSESELLTRILNGDADVVMPPPASHKKLSAAQKDILKRWIVAGAEYEPHWAFLPVQSVKVPTAADLPQSLAPQFLKWPQNPIDWFVLQRLAAAGLKPSPRAESSTLARRIALDLTGLPPRPELLTEFDLNRVDTYLDANFASPHYGERMAVDWLDAARFADTQGYQVDRDQDMHAWRDWVISAFNKNMPFDQFTIEQLAGDLLPQATIEQKIATGFHRNHMVNQEGGIIAAEFVAEYTADRVETTAAVWMGQTFTCTRCHDHKFDPFTQRDFYSLKAFFSSVGEQGDGGQDVLTIPAPEIDGQITAIQRELANLQNEIAASKIDDAEVERWAVRLTKQPLAWETFEIASVSGKQGAPHAADDRRSLSLGPVNRENSPIKLKLTLPEARNITALRVECDTDAADAKVSLGRISVQRAKKPVVLRGAVEGISSKAVQAAEVIGTGRVNVLLTPKPSQAPAALVWQLEAPLEANKNDNSIDFNLTVTDSPRETKWRLLYTTGPTDQLVAKATLDYAAKSQAKRKAGEQAALRQQYQLTLAETKAKNAKIAELETKIAVLRKQLPTAVVMLERAKPKETFILMRGVYDKPGEKVVAATPAVLPPLPKDAPHNRLGLAQWLVSPEHPLTARVTVNRLWQSVFGVGLVRTSEDFGSQGEAPSHPELLDWLAGEFIRSGWDVRHMLRLMLTSATYQQSSRITSALLAVDPDNRLLARGPRFRLHAEFVRDQALAAAGLLSERIGGKSVKPYHPPGLYELVTAGSTTNVYVEDKGEGLHRRSMYTYWKRSVPHPAMLAFDAPGREVCALRRPRSNTPLQALNLMNDPTYVEAARHLAARMLYAGVDLKSQIQFGYRALLARDPTQPELAVLTRAFERNRAEFTSHPESAVGLLKTGAPVNDTKLEPAALAAMTAVASTLFCLDETVTKE